LVSLMPQLQLPLFPSGVTHITAELAFMKRDGRVTYFNGQMPVFSHLEKDIRTFKMITAQFCIDGNARQVDIVHAFGVTRISVKRAVKLYREHGPQGFFAEPRRRGAAVLTAPVLAQAQQLFDDGLSVPQVADRIGLKPNTLAKAVRAGRLHHSGPAAPSADDQPASSKSQRSTEDGTAAMGMATSNTLDRVAASLGCLDGVPTSFQPALDVPSGGVLLALPALLASGLLQHTSKYFELPKGYYRLDTIFLLLAFMALARLKSIEALRYCAPGEWGKLLGLDRVPEVRTLRRKIARLSDQDQPTRWGAELSRDWMAAAPEMAGTFYIDGHVRVYHGHQTKLPRHYVARQRLCLRASTDYWVNAMDGQPFLLIHKAVDPGLLKVLEQDIVPGLEAEVPDQPSPAGLDADRLRHRFTLVFDREGYSPAFFLKMKQRRIACVSYHKHPGDDWPADEFVSQPVSLPNGQVVAMKLAERGVFLAGKLWLREIRKLTESGHQTAILATDYRSDLGPVAAAMFARWSQENFFKYMREHYSLDRLADYSTEAIPETTRVVNPAYRQLDGELRKQNGKLSRKLAEFGARTLDGDIDPKNVEQYQRKMAALKEHIAALQQLVGNLKSQRKDIDKHVTIADLPEADRFNRLATETKHLIDTIKMIAYRAETAMASLLRETMAKPDDARSLLRAIYNSEADLVPDEENGTLTLKLHHQASHSADRSIRHLCDELNKTDTVFPGTNLRLVYKPVSSQNHRDPEV
jgi:hypothetical protein